MLLSGCKTIGTPSGHVWPAPAKPQLKHIVITPVSQALAPASGYYLSSSDASNLADNVDELKAYIQKLEVLANTMTKYYGDKIEERK